MFKKSKLLRGYSDEELAGFLLKGLVTERDGYLFPTVSGAAVSAKWYTNGPKHLVNGDVDWDTSTNVMCALATSTYTPNQDTHEFYSDLTNEVANGNGYTTKGAAIGSRSVSVDTASNETRLIGGNVSWTSATFTARYAVIFRDSGTGSTSPLLGYVDFGADETVSAGTFSITWDATGILKITAA